MLSGLPTEGTDIHAASLAVALSGRIELLARSLDETRQAIEIERRSFEEQHESSALAQELVHACRDRLEGLIDDCRDLAATLDSYKLLAGTIVPAHHDDAPVPAEDDALLPAEDDALVPAEEHSRSGSLKAPLSENRPKVRNASGAGHVSDGVRLLATQMSMTGASLDEIARQLGDDFGVENADVVVLELFGHSS